MALDLSQFHQAFFEECMESLESMERSLLNLDPMGENAETINSIFRGAHSIKGGSATFGMTDVAGFTHVMETLLDDVRSGKRALSQNDVDLLLASVDVVREMLTAIQHGADLDRPRISAQKARLDAALRNPLTPAASSAAPTPSDEISEDEFESLLDTLHGAGQAPGAGKPRQAVMSAKPGEEITDAEFETLLDQLHGPGKAPQAIPEASHWRIVFVPHGGMLKSGNDPLRIFRELRSLGELKVQADTRSLPVFDLLEPEACYLGWTLELRANTTEAALREVFAWVEGDCRLEISQIDAGAAEPSRPAAVKETEAPPVAPVQALEPAAPQELSDVPPPKGAPATPMAQAGEGTSIRVAIDKIDTLINMVGELVITQSMLSQLADNFDMQRVPVLLKGLSQLERNTRELQENVMRIRMLPISFVLNRLPRLVRDLSAKLGKKVELTMFGEQTELDKTVLEKLGDPLVHLVRNSLDHGIEPPDVRRAKGKPEIGNLSLNAYHHSGNVVIEIADDGAGLNKEKILARARERGLVGADEVPSDDKIYELVCMPGFSTAETISDVSGRGVGMDVVKKNIKSLGGMLEFSSQPGKGTTIQIRLPLTLAILDGQSVRVGEDIYIIPLVSIVETIQIGDEAVNGMVGQAEVFRLRDAYLPIIRLYEVFSLKPRTSKLSEGLLVVVEGEGQRVGLFVDELLGQQQVVIKSLEANFRKIDGISGATILGDGTVALILDVPGLVKLRDTLLGQGKPQTEIETAA